MREADAGAVALGAPPARLGRPALDVERLRGRLELGLAACVGLTCMVVRAINLDRYSGSYPEGIRAEQLLLMAAGFRPFRDIFSDQGPWLLQALYPGFVLLGGSLAGVRLVVVLASLAGLAGAYWIARQVAGPVAGLAALVLLGLSPIYLQFSRLAVAEELALAPAILAIGCGLRFGRHPGPGWLLGAGILFAVSLLIKPITLGAAIPIGLAIWLGGRRPVRDLALVSGVVAATVLLGVLLVGLPEVVQQIVQFRLASRGAEGWSLGANLSRFRVELAPEGAALFGLAALGAVCAARRPAAWPLLVWPLTAAVTIMAHAPLHSKHFAVIVVPLAILAAVGVGRAASAAVAKPARPSQRPLRIALAGGLLVWGLSLAPLLARDARILTSDDLFERDEARRWYGEAAATLDRVVGPSEYLVTDHAYLAFAAGRAIPPGLVEASATRVRAGSLTDALAIDTTQRFGVRAVLLWADKLIDLKRYRAWLTEGYAPAKVWAAEGDTRPVLWLRNDERSLADRLALRAGLQPAPADLRFGPWRLASFGLAVHRPLENLNQARACPGDVISASLEWESSGEAATDAKVVLSLKDRSGGVVDDEQEPLLGGALRAHWLYWVGALPVPPTAASDYDLTAQLVDPRGRALGPPASLGSVSAGAC